MDEATVEEPRLHSSWQTGRPWCDLSVMRLDMNEETQGYHEVVDDDPDKRLETAETTHACTEACYCKPSTDFIDGRKVKDRRAAHQPSARAEDRRRARRRMQKATRRAQRRG